VILVGKAYWGPWLEWVKQVMMTESHYIEPEEFNIIQLVDSPEEAFAIIKETHERPYG
jgi:predicted Rossmann-fold nucleotide-binding protein